MHTHARSEISSECKGFTLELGCTRTHGRLVRGSCSGTGNRRKQRHGAEAGDPNAPPTPSHLSWLAHGCTGAVDPDMPLSPSHRLLACALGLPVLAWLQASQQMMGWSGWHIGIACFPAVPLSPCSDLPALHHRPHVLTYIYARGGAPGRADHHDTVFPRK